MDKVEIEKKWLEKLKPKGNKVKHGYLHFDNRIKNPKDFLSFISNPEKIAKHSFLPFAKFNKRKYKYREREKDGKRILIKKDPKTKKEKVREIMYAGHLDALIYVWYQCILEMEYEKLLEKNSLENSVIAYRRIKKEESIKGKSNIDFAYETFSYIKDKGDGWVAIAFDIEDFFPSLSHKILKEKLCKILNKTSLPIDHWNVYKSLTRYSFVNIGDTDIKKVLKINTPGQKANARNFFHEGRFSGEKFRELKKEIRKIELFTRKRLLIKNPEEKGIPQGSPLSGILANIYLIDFDRKMNDILGALGGLYRRYSDDIIIACPKSEGKKVEEKVENELNEKLELKINSKKTKRILFTKKNKKITSFKLNKDYITGPRESLQYLGFEFDGENIFIRSGSIARFYNQLKYGIKKTKANQKNGHLLKRKFYDRYTPMGKSNFFSYVKKAKKIIPKSKLSRQLKKTWKMVKEIEEI